ncbi:hypothetical protein [Ensifer sp. ZNC0028]|uniref:hypothetical protein n=1 Tax=Ensifer sp. ZNC0028 TaxID=1339236 RepID=UPI00068EC17E|nr:hypothetical protein [Ensifer sp. ZNC0028]
MLSFNERALKFGHSLEALKAGDEIQTTRQVHSIEELRDLLHDGSSPEMRQARARQYEKDHPKLMDEANGSMEALYLRAEAAVHADRPLSHDDALALKHVFPTTVRLLSALDKTISSEWTLGNESTPVSINVGTLTINQGGYINAYATSVTFVAQAVVNNASGGSSGANYTIGIFGAPGAAGTAGTNQPQAQNGQNGSSSGTPSPGVCTGAKDPTAGTAGSNGAAGTDGQRGADGTPNLTANFTFNAMSQNPIYLLTQSGAGGQGGAGGSGGAGGIGGIGGDGCQSGCEGTQSANGGNGGAGGNGGNGGPGGNGVDGHPINVMLASGIASSMLQNGGLVAPAGTGGAAGNGGTGGTGGAGGSGSGKHRSAGTAGTAGSPGANGTVGTTGTYTGNPGTISITTTG